MDKYQQSYWTTPNLSDWGLPPHLKLWRPHQLETVEWGLELDHFGLLESPTGSGKTGVARAIMSRHDGVSVVKTKILQETVYKEHGFAVVMGKGNYPCINPEGRGRTAEDCLYRNSKMSECGWYRGCPYLKATRRMFSSPAASINYAYYLGTKHLYDKRECYVYDEAHLLPEITLEYVGIGINMDSILKWQLPRPPKLLVDGTLDITGLNRPDKAVEWLNECIPILSKVSRELHEREDKVGLDLFRQVSRLLNRFCRAKDKLEQNPLVWFIDSNEDTGFSAKPLTARYHWLDLFEHRNKKIILMSGTIGDFETLAKELGIVTWDERRVPNRFLPERRPVYDLGAPKLSYKSSPLDFDEQARLIAGAIKSVPEDWDGVIHTTKKQHAQDLANRLARLGLQERVWVTPITGSDKQIEAWELHKKKSRGYKRPGQLALAWAWSEGVDLREEKICITAKCLLPDVMIASPEKKGNKLSVNTVKVGSEVYTLDNGLRLITTKVKDIIMVNWYDGYVYHWGGKEFNVSVTAEHEMIVRHDDKSRWKKVEMIHIPSECRVVKWFRNEMAGEEVTVRVSQKVTKERYQGSVWCVETEAGSILAGRGDHFMWVGNCPFSDLSNPYEKARFEYSHSFYLLRAAWALQQELGRTRRGEEEDYDEEGDMKQLVAIADGNYKRVQKYLSNDFRESIVSVE